ncbi:hypothetical protein, partial [Escherichia coli]|uniref:hypothetical protein n=1 Tax=Escherichia coli TaxID=562 RepID=UPI00202FC299
MTLFPLLPQSEQDRIISKTDELIQTCNKLKYIIKTAKQTQLHLADALTDAAINKKSRPHKTKKAAKRPLYSHHQKLYFTLIFILFSLIFS